MPLELGIQRAFGQCTMTCGQFVLCPAHLNIVPSVVGPWEGGGGRGEGGGGRGRGGGEGGGG